METWIYIAAALQLALGVLELVRWPSVTKLLLGITDDGFNRDSRPLGQNFAAYNILIAIGLIATTFVAAADESSKAAAEATVKDVQIWLLGSVVVAAIIGGITTKWFLALLQGLVPAIAIYMITSAA